MSVIELISQANNEVPLDINGSFVLVRKFLLRSSDTRHLAINVHTDTIENIDTTEPLFGDTAWGMYAKGVRAPVMTD